MPEWGVSTLKGGQGGASTLNRCEKTFRARSLHPFEKFLNTPLDKESADFRNKHIDFMIKEMQIYYADRSLPFVANLFRS